MSHDDDDDRDLFDKIMGRDDVLTYTDIIRQIDALKSEVDNLDDDSLVDEVNALQYNLDGPESRKIAKIALKNFSNEDLSEEETEFLKNVYITYYSAYAVLVDEEEEDAQS
jgi:hypothetical protein